MTKKLRLDMLCTGRWMRQTLNRTALKVGNETTVVLKNLRSKIELLCLGKAARSSALERSISNLESLEAPGLNPPLYYYLDLFSVVPSSTPRPRCVNSQLVSLPTSWDS